MCEQRRSGFSCPSALVPPGMFRKRKQIHSHIESARVAAASEIGSKRCEQCVSKDVLVLAALQPWCPRECFVKESKSIPISNRQGSLLLPRSDRNGVSNV